MWSFGANAINNSTTTRYLPHGFIQTAPTTPLDELVTAPLSFGRISFVLNNAGSGSGTITGTLRKNGAATALIISHAANAAPATATPATITYAVGDSIGFQITKTGTLTAPTDVFYTIGP